MKEELIRLLRRKWVSPVTALREVGCMSLSQRCGELRRAGVNVVSRWEQKGGKRWKVYTIVKKGC